MRAHRFIPERPSRIRLARLLCVVAATVAVPLATSASAGALTKLTAFVTTASPSVSVGGTISDTAVVIGAPDVHAPKPGGTVSFSLYGPDDTTCANAPVFTTGPIPTKQNTLSGPFSPTLPGTYRWLATYSGDMNYAPATTKCSDSTEAVLVTAVTPTITTTASPSVPTGGSVTDTAVLTGGMAPTGIIHFRIFQPADTTCAGPAVGGSDIAITDPSSTVSAPYTPPIAGTFRWRAFYSGDQLNGATSSKCNDPGESVDVTPGPGQPGGPPGSGGSAIPGSTPSGPCDPAATARAVLAGLAAVLTGKPAAFSSSCSAGLRIVLRAHEIRPGNKGFPRGDGFTTMTNILTHIAPKGPPLSFFLNSNGLALRSYAQSHGLSLVAFLIVHIRPDKSALSTESLQILTLG